MSKIVGLVSKPEQAKEKYKEDLLEVLDEFRQMVESGEITEYVISSLDKDGEVILTACCKDLVGGVGMLEMAKTALIQQ